jgi:hypothetical protein
MTRAARTAENDRLSPAAGWAGVAFVVLLLFAEAAVSLPRTTHSDAFISAYYADHRAVIAVDQVVQLFCSYLLWRWLRSFVATTARTTPMPSAGLGRIRVTGLAVVAASVLTCLAVLVLALVPSLGDRAVRLVADATDWTDVLLFLAITGLGLACAQSGHPTWLRASGAVLAVVAAAHSVLSVLGSTLLEVVAPMAFLLFVLAVSVWLIRRSRLGAPNVSAPML